MKNAMILTLTMGAAALYSAQSSAALNCKLTGSSAVQNEFTIDANSNGEVFSLPEEGLSIRVSQSTAKELYRKNDNIVDHPVTVIDMGKFGYLAYETGANHLMIPAKSQEKSFTIFCDDETANSEASPTALEDMKQMQCEYQRVDYTADLAVAPAINRGGVIPVQIPGAYVSSHFDQTRGATDTDFFMEVSDPLYNFDAVALIIKPQSRFVHFQTEIKKSVENGYQGAKVDAVCRQLAQGKPVKLKERKGVGRIIVEGLFEYEITRFDKTPPKGMQAMIHVQYEDSVTAAEKLFVTLPSGRKVKPRSVYISEDQKTHVHVFAVDTSSEPDAEKYFHIRVGGTLKKSRIRVRDILHFFDRN